MASKQTTRSSSTVDVAENQTAGGGRALPGSVANLGGVFGRLARSAGGQAKSTAMARSAEEEQALAAQSQGLTDLSGMISQGPGSQDVAAGLQSQREFADLLQKYQQGGFNPSQADFETARGQVGNLFAGQQESLNQQMQQQQRMAQRNAALTGRGINDPVFQNMQNQMFTNQQQQLEANKTSATQDIANQQPGQRIQYAEALTQTRLGLGNQAMQNRQLLLSLGNQIREQERNFRLNAAGRNTTQTTTSNPGALGIVSGVAGAAGSVMSGLGSMKTAGFFSGGEGGGAGTGIGSPGGPSVGMGNLRQMESQMGGGGGGAAGFAQAAAGGGGGSPNFGMLQQVQGAATGFPNFANGPSFNQAFNQATSPQASQAYGTPAYNTGNIWGQASRSNTISRRAAGGWAY